MICSAMILTLKNAIVDSLVRIESEKDRENERLSACISHELAIIAGVLFQEMFYLFAYPFYVRVAFFGVIVRGYYNDCGWC